MVMRAPLGVILVHCLMFGAGVASAQQPSRPAPTSPAPTPPADPAPQPAPAPRDNPGLLNELGKLWDNSTSLLPSLKNDPPPSPPEPDSSPPIPQNPAARPQPARPAAPAVVAPPRAKQAAPAPPAAPAEPPSRSVPSMVTGRATCPLSANGAPDCKTGAIIMCVNKGFKTGSSVAIDTSEKCSAKRLIPGRQRQADDCKTESFVTRALCQ
jgi:hypothetical protein